MIDLSGSNHVWPGPFRLAVRDILRASDAETAFEVAPSCGLPELRRVVGRSVCARDPIIIGGLRGVIGPLIVKRRKIIVERPTFLGVVAVMRDMGADVELHDDASIIDALDNSVAHQTLCWVTSPARNPDADTLDSSRAQALSRFRDAGGLVVRNTTNAFHMLPEITGSLPGPNASSVAEHQAPLHLETKPGEIVIGSFAKLIGSWARLGWLAGDLPEGIQYRIRHAAPSALMQRFWADALQDNIIAPALVARAASVTETTRRAAAILSPTTPWSGGSSILLQTRLTEPVEALANMRIRANDGRAFGAATGTVRLSFLGISDLDLVLSAVNQIRQSGLLDY